MKTKYNYLKVAFVSILLVKSCLFNLNKESIKIQSLSNFDLQILIDQATRQKKILELKCNTDYFFDKNLNITCSIRANGCKIIPKNDNLISVKITKSNIFLKDLTIIGADLKSVEVNADNITLDKCIIKSNQQTHLLIIAGNSTILESCVINNSYKAKQSFAIYNSNKSAIRGLKIANCTISGGIRLNNNKDEYSGNFEFINNIIRVDYTNLNQDFINQNDAIRLAGIEDVSFVNNKFYFKNVNRGFKFTDFNINDKNKKFSRRPTTRVLLKSNQINSDSSNGKQLFDMYDGSGIIDIENNLINAKGHTIVFEDKSTFLQNSERHLRIVNNKIYYDFRLIYYRGVLGQKVSLTVIGNNFYFNKKTISSNISRIGNSEIMDVKLKYLVFARDISKLNFNNNKFHNEKVYIDNTRIFYSLMIYRVKSAFVTNNDILGGVNYTFQKGDNLSFQRNTVFNNKSRDMVLFSSVSDTINRQNVVQKENKRLSSNH